MFQMGLNHRFVERVESFNLEVQEIIQTQSLHCRCLFYYNDNMIVIFKLGSVVLHSSLSFATLFETLPCHVYWQFFKLSAALNSEL